MRDEAKGDVERQLKEGKQEEQQEQKLEGQDLGQSPKQQQQPVQQQRKGWLDGEPEKQTEGLSGQQEGQRLMGTPDGQPERLQEGPPEQQPEAAWKLESQRVKRRGEIENNDGNNGNDPLLIVATDEAKDDKNLDEENKQKEYDSWKEAARGNEEGRVSPVEEEQKSVRGSLRKEDETGSFAVETELVTTETVTMVTGLDGTKNRDTVNGAADEERVVESIGNGQTHRESGEGGLSCETASARMCEEKEWVSNDRQKDVVARNSAEIEREASGDGK